MFKYILFILFLIPIQIFAQTDANLTGHVVDAATDDHIPFVSIHVKGTNIATTTDATGHYFIKSLPLGKITLVVTNLGYKTAEQSIVIKAKTLHELNFDISKDVMQLDEALVKSDRGERLRSESPSLIKLLPKAVFENTNSSTLSQGLNYQPGLRVENNCQNCGTQQIRINGLDGPYSQIMIDGQALMSALTSVYGVEQIPANMIDRVEVVRGGGTAISGASAIGGSVNIITKEPVRNTANLSNSTSIIGGKAFDYSNFLNASLVSDNSKLGSYIYASIRDRSPYDHDGDGFSEIGDLKGTTIGLRTYYKTSDYTKLSLEYHNMNEYRRGGDSLDLPAHQANITEQLEHRINGGGLRFDILSHNYKSKLSIHASGQDAHRKSYFGTHQSPNGYGKTHDQVLLTGGLLTHAIDRLWLTPAELSVGVDYHYNKLNDQIVSFNHALNQTTHLYSAYAQNEWKSSNFSLLLGLRADKHNLLSKALLSPRANARFNLKQGSVFRASYSEGFRAPQAYNEDLHVSIAGGNPVLIVLNPNLKEERSNSYSLSADLFQAFGSVRANLLIEGFYTHLKNVFRLEQIGTDPTGNIIMERKNANAAVVKGINFEAKLIPHNNVEVQVGLTLQSSNFSQAEKWSDDPKVSKEKRLFRSPNTYGFMLATYQATKAFLVSVSGTYTGSMLVQHLEGFIESDKAVNTPTFMDMGIKLAYNFKLTNGIVLQTNIGMQNMFNAYQNDFDKGIDRDANYIYGPALPRTFNFGCKLEF